jgi:hypothetical protein
MRFLLPSFLLSAGLLVLMGDVAAAPAPSAIPAPPAQCLAPTWQDPDPPAYYAIDLVSTKKVSGARMASGTGNVTFSQSPFGVSVSTDGQYVYNLAVAMQNIRIPEGKAVDVWVTTPRLDQTVHLGRLGDDLTAQGSVAFNKFLVVVSLEDGTRSPGTSWSGPIIARGMSRSGLMHTMAGHGPFESEPCATYGYN